MKAKICLFVALFLLIYGAAFAQTQNPDAPLIPPFTTLFSSGSSEVHPAAHEHLITYVISQVKQLKDSFYLIKVEGYSDIVGEPESNMKLSQKRAESLVAILIENGIPMQRIQTSFWGEIRPVSAKSLPNQNHAEWLRNNRRVVVTVAYKKQ